MNLLEKITAKVKWLRTEPDSVKTKYVQISALIIFAIVFLLWAGFFRKHERPLPDDGRSNDLLIEQGKRLKDMIKLPKISLPEGGVPIVSPEVSPEISPEVSPAVSPEATPGASPVASPKISPVVSPKI